MRSIGITKQVGEQRGSASLKNGRAIALATCVFWVAASSFLNATHAAKRAAASGGSLIVVYVVPADYGWLRIGRDESRDLDRSLQRQAVDRLRAFADENVGDMPADLEVRVGQPAEEIVAAARESKCDSIMESVGDARSFLSAAREVALTKPIIAIKVGRTRAAAKAAASHTGALMTR